MTEKAVNQFNGTVTFFEASGLDRLLDGQMSDETVRASAEELDQKDVANIQIAAVLSANEADFAGLLVNYMSERYGND